MKVEKVNWRNLVTGDEFVNAEDWESLFGTVKRSDFRIRNAAKNLSPATRVTEWVYRITLKEDK